MTITPGRRGGNREGSRISSRNLNGADGVSASSAPNCFIALEHPTLRCTEPRASARANVQAVLASSPLPNTGARKDSRTSLCSHQALDVHMPIRLSGARILLAGARILSRTESSTRTGQQRVQFPCVARLKSRPAIRLVQPPSTHTRQRLNMRPGLINRARQQDNQLAGSTINRVERNGGRGAPHRRHAPIATNGFAVRNRKPEPDTGGSRPFTPKHRRQHRDAVAQTTRGVQKVDKFCDRSRPLPGQQRHANACSIQKPSKRHDPPSSGHGSHHHKRTLFGFVLPRHHDGKR